MNDQVYYCAREYDLIYSMFHIKKYKLVNVTIVISKSLPKKGYKHKLEKFSFIKKVVEVDDDGLHDNLFFRDKRRFVGVLLNLCFLMFKAKKIYGLNKKLVDVIATTNIQGGTANLFFLNTALKVFVYRNSLIVNLLEEGEGIYVKKFPKLYLNLRRFLGLGCPYGKEKKVKFVFLSKCDKYSTSFGVKKNIEFILKDELILNYDSTFYFELLSLFGAQEIKCRRGDDPIVLLTQPLSEDGICEEKTKIDFYREMYIHLSRRGEVYLKLHPRDFSIYDFCIDDRIIERDLPMELIKFDKAISEVIALSSSSVNNIFNVKNAMNLVSGREINRSDIEYAKYKQRL